MFHLFTHAFFKALLFLGAGSVIHAMHHQQDMRHYGGLWQRIPTTFITMLIGTLAITGFGVPLTHLGLAGFLSKDAIVESTFAAHTVVGSHAFWLLVAAAAMTSFYSWRLMFMTFFGTPRGDLNTHAHAHESPMAMLVPLLVLAFGSIFAGMMFYSQFFGTLAKGWFVDSIFMAPGNHVLAEAHHVPNWVKASPFVAMVVGFLFAWVFYILRPGIPAKLAASQRPLYLLLLNKWYFDEIYEFLFVRPAKWIGRFLWQRGDLGIIDGILHAVAKTGVPYLTQSAVRLQTGYLFHYAFIMVTGAVLLIVILVVLGVVG